MNKVQLFIVKTMEKDFLEKAEFIGYSEEEAVGLQFKRIMMSFVYLLIAIFFLTQKLWTASIVFIVLGFFAYKTRYYRIQSAYKNARYNQQISYSIFTRLVDTYLSSGESLYTIFGKISTRLKSKQSQSSIARLMGKIQEDPENKKAFQEFGRELSVTDDAQNFMTTLYYSQFTTDDKSVVKELGQMAVKEVLDTIGEIVEIKTNQIEKFGRIFLYVSLILIVGILMAFAVMHFDQVMTPMQQ